MPDELLLEIVEAARWAPSAVNIQPWEFIVVTDPQMKAAVGQHARYLGVRWPHIHEAPALIVVCARRTTKFARDDCIFAAANLLLAATDRGLGTCWIGGFNERLIAEILSVPADYLLPGFCTIGYPAEVTEPPPKRSLEDLVHRDSFTGRPGVPYLRGPLEVLGRILRLQLRRRPRA